MKKLIRIEKQANTLFVHWKLTDFCNQACHYCPSFLHDGRFAKGILSGALTDTQIVTLCDRLAGLTQDRPGILTILGGEPTVHNMLPVILEKLNNSFSIEIVTNGSRGLSWWKELKALPHTVVISLHPEYYDTTQFRINELTDFLINNNVRVCFNLMCDPANWDRVVSMYNGIRDEYKCLVVPTMILEYITPGNRKLLTYNNEQTQFIKKLLASLSFMENTGANNSANVHYSDGSVIALNDANFIINENNNRFKGWSCSAGRDSISIGFNGAVSAGICGAKRLGHAATFKLSTENLICPKDICACTGDVILSKFDLHPEPML
jgi:organic radical activating enzyme